MVEITCFVFQVKIRLATPWAYICKKAPYRVVALLFSATAAAYCIMGKSCTLII